MSAMANTTPIMTTVTKPATNPRDADATPRVRFRERFQRKKNSSARARTTKPERLKVRDRLRYGDRHVLDRLGHRRQSAFDRLSETYSSSTTKSRPRRTDFRDHPGGRSRPRRLDTSNEDCLEDRERFCGVGESDDDSFSYSYRDGNRSCHMKKRRDNESPLSSVSKSDSSDRRYQKSRSKRHKPMDEDDLTRPWMCEEEDTFTPRICNFKSSRKTRMPNNVKTYDGTGDPKDHVKIFQAAAQVERWKYVKDPVEIYNIKQKDRETIEDFIERFKVKIGRMNGAPECMRISGFMHGVNNLEMTKRLNEHVPKTREKMMITTIAFIRGEAAAASKKKGHTSWRAQDQSKRQTSKKMSDFRGHPREGRGSSRFTPLQGRQKRFLRPRRIRELVRAGKLSHLIKEIKHGQDQSKTGKKEIPAKDKPATIYMIQSSQRMTRQKVTQSFEEVREITFPPLTASSGVEGPLIIEAEIGGHMIHRMLLVTIGDADHSTRAWMNFMIVRSLSPCNGIIGRPLNTDSISERDIHLSGKRKGARPLNVLRPYKQSWRMCVDFTDLNKACPQDCYPLPEIDWKVESLSGYQFKCFLNAYKGYHQIQLAKSDEEKIAFHIGQGVYCYTKMPFGLKNVGATYQRLVDKAFDNKIGRNIEVAAEGVFLGYVVTPEGIKLCHDKTASVLQLSSPWTIKEVQSLNGKLASLNRFLSKSAKKSLPLFKTLKKCIKKSDFHWTTEAEQAFKQLKQHLSELPLMVAPKPTEELIGPELNFTPMEKLVLSLVFAAKRLRRYFQAHPIAVITNQPIKKIMSRLDVAGRLQKWSIMQGEQNITYRPRTSVKGQILADFLTKMPDKNPPATPVAETQQEPWTLFTDGSSCVDGSGARLILTSPEGTKFTYALRFQFVAFNNEVEYEALIAGLRIAEQMGVQNVHVNVDSKLVANQVLGTYVANEENMIKYLEKVKSLVSGFTNFSICQVLVKILKEKSIKEKEVTSVVEEDRPTWMTPIMEYLKEGTLLSDRKRSFLTSWLRCIGPFQAENVIREIHEGSCSMHVGPRLVVAKAIRLGYYWPTMHRDARDMIRTCNNCQIHRPVTRNPQQPLTSITAPWPFYKWGIDIAGPFPKVPGKVKFLIVAMDYFTKWIEAKAVATITGSQVKKFVWDNIVCRFEIGMPMCRTTAVDVVYNDEELRLNLDLLEERRERAAIRNAKAKLKMTKYYNARVRGITFRPGDFVYRSNDASHVVEGGKLGPKWEGPYEVTEALGDETYKLRSTNRTVLPRM
nr:reverse transcriptase domain-containing protein [Tanacetum cinerariifolium]